MKRSPLGPAPARESYLDIEKLIAAALKTGAEAVHPGYGFLSENATFAERLARGRPDFRRSSGCRDPRHGLKSEAKTLMEKAGVPVVPGYHGAKQHEAALAEAAARIGYPVLLKAAAGGGGKGMRRVDGPADFAAALAGARREAKAAFGDDSMLVGEIPRGAPPRGVAGLRRQPWAICISSIATARSSAGIRR